MESDQNLFSNFGEKVWDDANINTANSSDLSNSGEVDILQQSLQEAQIYDGSIKNDPLDFDDFGFTINSANDSLNSIGSDNKQPLQSFSSSCNSTQNDFDVSDFLNLTSPSTKTTISTTLSNQTTNSTGVILGSIGSTNASQLQSVKPLLYHQPNTSLTLSGHEVLTSTQNNPTSSTNTNWAFAKPVTYIHLQLPKNEPALVSNYFTNTNALINQQNNTAHYVVSHIPAAASQSYVSPVTVRSISTVQNTSVAVNNVMLSKSAMLPISTSSFSLNVCPTATVASQMISQIQPVQNQQASASSAVILQQLPAGYIHDDQIIKLAHFLQTKAKAQSGSGSILKVGNQNIDISDPAVAKALASKILQQQKLKLQKQSNPHISNSNSAVAHTPKANVTVYNLTNFQNLSANQQVSQQRFNTNVTATVPSNFTSPKYSLHSENKVNSLSPSNVIGSRASPIVQINLPKSGSPMPINRIQIASVNIARTSTQFASNSPHRIASPVLQLPANATTVQQSPHNTRPQVVMSAQVVPVINSDSSSSVTQHVTKSIKVNFTHQPINSSAKERLQKFVVQQPGLPTPNSVISMNSIQTPVLSSPQEATSRVPTPTAQQTHKTKATKIVTFRVDPNLTARQVEEVQSIIFKKLPVSKVNELTTEQKQLLSAFRAQLRTMEPPIQQYYLRNPDLFLQKVYQHTRTGKPFMFQVKVEQSNTKSTTSLSNSVMMKPTHSNNHHPTITLSGSDHKMSVASTALKRAPSALPRKSFKRPQSNSPEVVVGQPLSKRPSLITEQLLRHRELAGNPATSPFKNARDAFRRLLPYHVYNTPQICETHFEKAESLFERISHDAIAKTTKMINKYHLLCLKDASMDVCSADAVMLERAFLQHEKAVYADMKHNIRDDPDALLTYLPPSYADTHPDVITFMEDRVNAKLQLQVVTPCSGGQSFKRDVDPTSNMKSTGDNTSVDRGNPPQCGQAQSDLLLQEAVESILS